LEYQGLRVKLALQVVIERGEETEVESFISHVRPESRILIIRGHKVMLDVDLAEMYGIPTKRLNEQIKRNLKRFPIDFMFQLTKDEAEFLRSQIATSKKGSGGRRYLPLAFTELGVAMLSSVLNSERAILVNVEIMRAFVRLRQVLSTHKDMARKLDDLEKKMKVHDTQIQAVFDAIRELMKTPEKPKRRIGFLEESKAVYRAD
jgi:hypothetical protein